MVSIILFELLLRLGALAYLTLEVLVVHVLLLRVLLPPYALGGLALWAPGRGGEAVLLFEGLAQGTTTCLLSVCLRCCLLLLQGAASLPHLLLLAPLLVLCFLLVLFMPCCSLDVLGSRLGLVATTFFMSLEVEVLRRLAIESRAL